MRDLGGESHSISIYLKKIGRDVFALSYVETLSFSASEIFNRQIDWNSCGDLLNQHEQLLDLLNR